MVVLYVQKMYWGKHLHGAERKRLEEAGNAVRMQCRNDCCGGQGRKNLRLWCGSKEVLVRLMGSRAPKCPIRGVPPLSQEQACLCTLVVSRGLGGAAGGKCDLSSNTVMQQLVCPQLHYRVRLPTLPSQYFTG